ASSSRAKVLADAINEGRDETLRQARQRADEERPRPTPSPQPASVPATSAPASRSQAPAVLPESPATPVPPRPAVTVVLPVTGVVDQGDVVVMDPDDAGTLRASTTALDTTVAGCAAQPDEDVELPPGHAAVGLWGIVLCRADAGYGAIKIGDLLATSATPGHAKRADAGAVSAILGKAMEPLPLGTGLIRVLIALR